MQSGALLSSFIVRHNHRVDASVFSYCYGGSSCVRLGGTDLVNSVVICHPGTCTINQAKAMVCAEGSIFRGRSLGN